MTFRGLATAGLALAMCLTALASKVMDSNAPETTLLWRAGDGGYDTYRIPGIVVTATNTVLAYGVARRKLEDGDWSDSDIMLRRSTDGGKHWDSSRRIAGDSHGVTDNPIAIASRQKGLVHFLYQHDYSSVFYMRSTNDGTSFTSPVDITEALEDLRPQYAWNVVALGPGHGIELKNGRLLAPVWLAASPTNKAHRDHAPSGITTPYSDDSGRTWKHGDVIAWNAPAMANPNEMQLVQLSNGSVMANFRTGDKALRRAIAVSTDGVTHWSKPVFDPNLFDPICAAGIVQYGNHRLLFTNPDSSNLPLRQNGTRGLRQNLTIRLSNDDGITWPVARILLPGPTGYSDIAANKQHEIYDIYEAPAKPEARTLSLYVAHLPPNWLNEQH